jgi:hypothetical protein
MRKSFGVVRRLTFLLSKLAPVVFGIGLICSGQSSTVTGTIAGQAVMMVLPVPLPFFLSALSGKFVTNKGIPGNAYGPLVAATADSLDCHSSCRHHHNHSRR